MSAEKLEGFHSSNTSAEPDEKALPDVPCRFVLLSNWNVDNSKQDRIFNPNDKPITSSSLNGEIYWGFDGKAVHPLYITQTSIMIPVSNANQIFVRSSKRAIGKFVYFSCFK